MLRDAIFRSGVPALIASMCVVATVYLAIVRGERLARYWSVAWTLLVGRYAWNAYWGSPFPRISIMSVALVLRMAFAASVLGGVFALRGERFPVRWIVMLALAVPLPAVGLQLLVEVPGLGAMITSVATLALLCVAAWRLATAAMLPLVERVGTAGALLAYAISTSLSWQLQDGSSALMAATMIGWGAQLLIGIGLLATFLRVSYDKEVASRLAMESRLAEALGGFVHLCMHCKAVRDEQLQWQPLERFVSRRTSSQLSHGVCDECARAHYPDAWNAVQAQSA